MTYKKTKKRVARIPIALLLVFLLLLAGCWSNRDLSEINIVTGIGLDRTEDGKILLAVQVVEPAAIQSTSSGKGKGGVMQARPVFVESYKGETVLEAVRGMLSTVDKKMFLSTAQVLILGENLLKDGMEEVLDFFQRNYEVDYRMNILAAKGVSPGEILEIEPDMDSIPATYINGTVENTILRGTVKKTILIDLLKDIGSGGKQPAIGQISKAGEKEVRTEGIAVIKNGRLVGWLDSYETRGYLLAINEVRNAIVNVPIDKGKVAMEIIRSKGRVNVVFDNDEPIMLTVKTKIEANVGGYEGKGRLDSPDNLRTLEEALEEEIKKEIMMVLKKTQQDYSSDIFGFGVEVHKYHPQYWKKVKKNWDDIFSTLPVELQVDAKIRRTGLVNNPIKKDE